VTIRKAQTADASILTKLAQDACRNGGYPDNWIESAQSASSTDVITGNDVYVADQSGELLGFYVLAGDGLELEQLWVAPSHFGTGVGKELFLHAKDRIALKESSPQ
jgi:GNAT superfamily N-acetyltransferase